MIEILIIYVLSKHETTIYGIRKGIIDYFGIYTKPSVGAIYPALKKLLKENAVVVNERISEGGKKSSYYSLTKTSMKYLKKIFYSSLSENPSLFYTQLMVRICAFGILTSDERKKFILEFSKKIEIYQFETKNKLKDEYLNLDYYQKQLLTRTYNELETLNNFLKNLQTDLNVF